MTKLMGWCRISASFILQINIIFQAVGFILVLDLYKHIRIGQTLLSQSKMSFFVLGLSSRLSLARGCSLCFHLFAGIVGMLIARNPSIYKYVIYMLTGSITLLYFIVIAVTRYIFDYHFEFYANMILREIWARNDFDQIEDRFDCCGRNGRIDYLLGNRTWSKGSCCELSDCSGCQDLFIKYLHNIEMEIARDNIILFICLAIALILMIVHFNDVNVNEDPYISDSDSPNEEDEVEDEVETEDEAEEEAEDEAEDEVEDEHKDNMTSTGTKLSQLDTHNKL